MARIRSLKPSIWTDERFIDLSRDARLLFIGMVSHADDDGRLVASGAALIGVVFPHDDLTARQVEKWRDELVTTGLVQIYKSGRGTYAALPGWRKHQRIQKPQRSTLPPPPGPEPVAGQSATESRTGSTTEWEGEVEKEWEKEGECGSADADAHTPSGTPSTTDRLVAEHVEGLGGTLPDSVEKDLRRRIAKLLLSGSQPEHVAAGLAKARRKGLSLRLLDQLVAESIPAGDSSSDPLTNPAAQAFLAGTAR